MGLLAFGLTFVVVAGEIDISIMSTMAVAAVACAQIWHAGVNIWLAVLAALGISAGLGLVNGLLVGVLDLPSLAVTLGTLAAYRGLAYVLLGGGSVSDLPAEFTKFGGGYIHTELPNALIVLFVFALGLGLLLHATRFGRYVYVIGSNREVARFSGIPVTVVRVMLFVISGADGRVRGNRVSRLLRFRSRPMLSRVPSSSTSSQLSCSAASTSSEDRERWSASSWR